MSKRGWRHFWKISKWLNPLGEAGEQVVNAQKKGDKKHDKEIKPDDQKTGKS